MDKTLTKTGLELEKIWVQTGLKQDWSWIKTRIKLGQNWTKTGQNLDYNMRFQRKLPEIDVKPGLNGNRFWSNMRRLIWFIIYRAQTDLLEMCRICKKRKIAISASSSGISRKTEIAQGKDRIFVQLKSLILGRLTLVLSSWSWTRTGLKLE